MRTGVKDTLKFIAAAILRALLKPLTLLPIKPRRVVFLSYRGSQYSCSPKYISEALENRELELIWGFKEPEKYGFLEARGVKTVNDRSFRFIIYALTARAVVTNSYYKPYLPRRSGQLQLRTWHGGGAYKRVAGAQKLPPLKKRYLRMQLSGANLYLSSSRAFTDMTIRASFGYRGEVLKSGLPRNDLLINSSDAGEIRAELGLKPDEKLVMYAPTYREAPAPELKPDAGRLLGALKKRFGGEWVYACRGHRYMAPAAGEGLDLSGYPDMQRLLLCADALVTDYSSAMWDMSLTLKPVFLYAPDLDEYIRARDFYTDIHTWPFPLARTDAELSDKILSFDAAAYARAVKKHHSELGSYEKGTAAALAARRILNACGIFQTEELQ